MNNIKKMVWLSILIAALGGIIGIIGIALFRHYSGQQTKKNFDDASVERKNIKDSLDQEFIHAIEEIQLQKNLIIEKIDQESNKYLSDLKIKSKDALDAIENLKIESEKATEKIAKNLTSFSRESTKNQEEIIGYVSTDSPLENLDNFVSTSLSKSLFDWINKLKSFSYVSTNAKYKNGSNTPSFDASNKEYAQPFMLGWQELETSKIFYLSLLEKLIILAKKTKNEKVLVLAEKHNLEFRKICHFKTNRFRIGNEGYSTSFLEYSFEDLQNQISELKK